MTQRMAIGTATAQARKGTRRAWCGTANDYVAHAVYDRYTLAAGASLMGPAIIEERESTTIVGHGGQVKVDGDGTLVIALPELAS